MKAFLLDGLFPFVAVTLTVAILTLALFDPPPPPSEDEPPATASPEPAPEPESEEPAASAAAQAPVDQAPLDLGSSDTPRGRRERDRLAKQKAMQDMNEIFARALRGLSFERPEPGETENPTESLDPNLPASLQKLGKAIRAARSARTEEDLVEAEKMLRGARQQMEQSCGQAGSPLCDSAKSIKELGY